MRNAAIAGASGLTGGHLLHRLLASSTWESVVSLGRKSQSIHSPRLIQKRVDFHNLGTVETPPLDTAFCCLGTTIRAAGSKEAFRSVDGDAVVRFAEWAHRHGARRFLVVSSVGASGSSASFYLTVKGDMERSLDAIGFEALDIFQPSFILGKRPERRLLERIGQLAFRSVAFLLAGPLSRYRPIRASALAGAMANRAESPIVGGTHRHEWASIRELAG